MLSLYSHYTVFLHGKTLEAYSYVTVQRDYKSLGKIMED